MKRLIERITILIIGAFIASAGYFIGSKDSDNTNDSVVEFDTIKCRKIEIYDDHHIGGKLTASGMIKLEIDGGHPTLFMSSLSTGSPGNKGETINLTTGGRTARLSMDTGHTDSDQSIVLFATSIGSFISINDVKVASSNE